MRLFKQNNHTEMNICNNILKQIANTIYINHQHIEQPGLLNGNMGITLFLYLYSRYTASYQYEILADELIDSIYSKMNKKTDVSFANGLGGIGWGFEFLKKQGFIEMDDEVLEEIDTAIYDRPIEEMLKEVDDEIPLYTEGIYYFMHNSGSKKEQKICIDLSELLIKMEDKTVPVTYLNSILYSILWLQHCQIENKTLADLLSLASVHIYRSLQANYYDTASLYILKNLVNNITERLSNKTSFIELSTFTGKRGGKINDTNLYFNWQNVIYMKELKKQLQQKDDNILSILLRDKIMNLDSKNLSLSGIAGLGINLMLG